MRLALALTGVLAVTACGPPADPPAGEVGTVVEAPARSYAVRGLVRGVQGRELTVAHEAIPDLVGPTGEADPMGAMTMTFLLAESIDPATVAPGDKLAFTLEIDWSADEPARVVAVEPLPAETELQLR